MRLLLIASLLLVALCARAQYARIPAIDLSANLQVLPPFDVLEGKTNNYSEVILKNSREHGFDTTQMGRVFYDGQRRLRRRDVFEYMPPDMWRKEGIENLVARKIDRAYATEYEFDAHGNVRLEKHYDLAPANSIVAVLQAAIDRYMQTVKPSERSSLKADDMVAGMRMYEDSLVRAGVPERTVLRDSVSTEYGTSGYPVRVSNNNEHLLIRYSYSLSNDGRINSARKNIENTADNAGRPFGDIEEYHFMYDPAKRISRITSYRAFHKALDSFPRVSLPQNLRREQFNYYNKAGRLDSVVYLENNQLYKHFMKYSADGQLKAYTILDKDARTGHTDTVLLRLFEYKQALVLELKEFQYYLGRRYEMRRENYGYNTQKLPVEMKVYKGLRKPELQEQHLYFYGDAYDAQTAPKRLPGEREGIPGAMADHQTDDKPRVDFVLPHSLDSSSSGTVHYIEQMPEFPGGADKYIGEHIEYPKSAQKAGIKGAVMIRFLLRKDGSIGEVTAFRKLEKACDVEAVRVIATMPNWKPGKINGRPTDVYLTLPVYFGNN